MNHIIISHTKFSDTKDKSFQIYPRFGTFTWRCAKSFEVLTLIFSTDCSPIDWLQSVLKITRFENVFLFFLFFENQASRPWGGEIGLVWCLGRSCCSESELWQEELFRIANHSAASQLFGDRISATSVDPRRAQKRPPRGHTGCVINMNLAGKFGTVHL